MVQVPKRARAWSMQISRRSCHLSRPSLPQFLCSYILEIMRCLGLAVCIPNFHLWLVLRPHDVLSRPRWTIRMYVPSLSTNNARRRWPFAHRDLVRAGFGRLRSTSKRTGQYVKADRPSSQVGLKIVVCPSSVSQHGCCFKSPCRADCLCPFYFG